MSIPLILTSPGGGGSATPGGNTGDIQFNNAGALGGEALVPLAHGGTNADLSASGGTTAVLAQDASHVITARNLVAADIPNHDASKITTGLLALARGGTNADLSASGSTTAVLAQDASHVITARSLVVADLPITGTGLVRNSGTASELSGDITTSGSNTATVVKVNGASVPVSATILGSNGSGQLVDNSSSLANVKVATLTLTSAQIKALNTTAIQIIAAPGAGLAINVWFVVWNYIAGGTGYATATGTLQLANSGLNFTIASVTGANLGLANAATNGVALAAGTSSQPTDATYVNTSRVVWISTANPTTGNGTIAIKVFYTIDTVS